MNKKVLSVLLSCALGLTAFGFSRTVAAEENAEGVSQDGKYELALVTDVGTIDDRSFNQGSWEGLKKYAEETGKSYKYYKPTEQADAAYSQAIDLAVKGGAKYVVCPGFLFEVPVFHKSQEYPDVRFILVDGTPHEENEAPGEVAKNVVGIHYREEQAGFLAGYAAVLDGSRKLGFMGGMAVPAVVRFGYGFIDGVEAAAKELGLKEGDATLRYTYTNSFNASPEIASQAASWFNDGIDTIFACGGQIGTSVMASAEAAKAKVIGVDIDQSKDSETVLTSAMKNLQLSVYEALKSGYEDKWVGGQAENLGAKEDMVLIAMETGRFTNFSKEQYDSLYEKVKNDEFKITSDADAQSPTEVKTELVKVEFIE